MIRAGRWLGAALLVVLVSGCSSFGIVYNRLDTLVHLEVGRYIDLTPSQRADFDLRFSELWRWHRQTQLKLYADDLRAFAETAALPVSADEVEALTEQARAHAVRLAEKTFDGFASGVATLNDAQVDDLLAELAARNAKERKKALKLDDDEWREKRAKESIERLDDWAGSVTPEQRQRIREWAAGLVRKLPPADASALQPLREVLAGRDEPEFRERLTRLFIYPELAPEDQAELEAERAARSAMLADLSELATDAQRRHLQKRLLEIARELDGLAARPV
jgi:hypothetical protein